jgi:hypothetical protein
MTLAESRAATQYFRAMAFIWGFVARVNAQVRWPVCRESTQISSDGLPAST